MTSSTRRRGAFALPILPLFTAVAVAAVACANPVDVEEEGVESAEQAVKKSVAPVALVGSETHTTLSFNGLSFRFAGASLIVPADHFEGRIPFFEDFPLESVETFGFGASDVSSKRSELLASMTNTEFAYNPLVTPGPSAVPAWQQLRAIGTSNESTLMLDVPGRFKVDVTSRYEHVFERMVAKDENNVTGGESSCYEGVRQVLSLRFTAVPKGAEALKAFDFAFAYGVKDQPVVIGRRIAVVTFDSESTASRKAKLTKLDKECSALRKDFEKRVRSGSDS